MLNHSSRFSQWVLALVAVLMSHSCFATEPEDGLDLFLKAINSQIQSQIFSGRGAFDLTTSYHKSEKDIQEEADQRIAQVKKDLPPDDPRREKIINGTHQSLIDYYSQTHISSGTFCFDHSQKGVQYTKDQITHNHLPNVAPFTITNIQKRTAQQTVPHIEGATFNSLMNSQVLVENTPSSSADFPLIGRVQGILALLISSQIESKGEQIARDEIEKQIRAICGGDKKDMKVLEIVETKPFDDGSTMYILESAVEGVVTQRYSIVPSLGYICPKIEIFDITTGNLVEMYEAKDFVKHTPSGLYYPTSYTELRYNVSTKSMDQKDFKINKETLFLNEKMSPQDFALDILEGYSVLDRRDGKEVEYIATASGVLSLDKDGLNLKKKSWLRRVDSSSQVPTEYKSLLLRVIFLVVGVILVAWGLSRRRRNKKSAAV